MELIGQMLVIIPFLVELHTEYIGIGQSEAIRLKENSFKLVYKFLEYLFKLSAAFLLASLFLFKKKYSKAYFILLVRFNVLIGFFLRKKI